MKAYHVSYVCVKGKQQLFSSVMVKGKQFPTGTLKTIDDMKELYVVCAGNASYEDEIKMPFKIEIINVMELDYEEEEQ